MFTIKISKETAARIEALTEIRVSRGPGVCCIKVSAEQVAELRSLVIKI